MRGIRRSIATAGLATVICISSAAAQYALVDSVVTRELRQRRIPGAAIAVVQDGRVLLKRAYGTANLETETPLHADAVFQLASITKQFTAVGIMLLVQEGKVRLDEAISTYIANTPPQWAPITVRQLLTHTGGLAISAVPMFEGSGLISITTKHVFDFVSKQPMQFAPGQRGWYSDAGYFLLGMIIEKAAGEPYRQFMQKRIFDPLQMTATTVHDRGRIIKGRVNTYAIMNGELANWRRVWDYELPSFFGIWSTLGDLVKWDTALRSASLLPRPTLDLMWTPAKLPNGQLATVLDRYYGFGFELSDLRGRRTVGHGGASGTYMLRFLDEPLTIIVLTNLESPSGNRHPIFLARSIAGALRPELRPHHMLEAGGDPNPALTRDVQVIQTEMTAGRESPLMSSLYRAGWAGSPGYRAVIRNQLGGISNLTYLAHDDVAGKPLWDPEPIDRLVHYRADVSSRPTYISAGLTRDGKIGRIDFYLYQ